MAPASCRAVFLACNCVYCRKWQASAYLCFSVHGCVAGLPPHQLLSAQHRCLGAGHGESLTLFARLLVWTASTSAAVSSAARSANVGCLGRVIPLGDRHH